MSEAPLPHELVRFAHNSERQFAKLLDFYGIECTYEPRTFTLEHDRDGRPGSEAKTVVRAVGKLRQRSRTADQQPGTPLVFLTILVAALALTGTLLGLW